MSTASTANRPLPGGRTMHLTTLPGSLPSHVILTGNPARADQIASFLDEARLVSLPGGREYRCYVGQLRDVPVGVVTHGMSSGSMATILREVEISGGRTLIRVGSCSSFVPNAQPGDLALIESEIRWDGASDDIIDPRIPAVADRRILLRLEEAAFDLGHTHHVGMGATGIGFYESQGRADENGYISSQMYDRLTLLRRLRAVSLQMETATLLAWATARRRAGIRAGAVHAIYANRFAEGKPIEEAKGDNEAIAVAFAALESLAKADRA